jgi:hypothetical protein
MVSGQSFLYITAAFPCEERAARKVSLIDQEHREIIRRGPHSCLVADLAPDGREIPLFLFHFPGSRKIALVLL